MRNDPISSPGAAELYFNQSIFGQLYALLAETLGRSDAGRARAADKADADAGTLLDRLDAWFWRQRQRDHEAYLAGSRDVFELERRMEALERGAYPRCD